MKIIKAKRSEIEKIRKQLKAEGWISLVKISRMEQYDRERDLEKLRRMGEHGRLSCLRLYLDGQGKYYFKKAEIEKYFEEVPCYKYYSLYIRVFGYG